MSEHQEVIHALSNITNELCNIRKLLVASSLAHGVAVIDAQDDKIDPKSHGATAAPSTAVAAQSSTVPADTMAITSIQNVSGPIPLAPSHVPVVPTVAAPLATPAPGVELDSAGQPWDGRIHANTKGKIGDGTWRLKRGVDDKLVAAVRAEHTAARAAPAAAVSIPDPTVAFGAAAQPWPFPDAAASAVAPAAPVGDNNGTAAPAIPVPPVGTPAIPAAPVATAGAPAPAPVVGWTFAKLMGTLPGLLVSGKKTQEDVTAACILMGLPNITSLSGRPDLVPHVAAALGLTE